MSQNLDSDKFQAQLKNDIDKIKQCPDFLVFADKTCKIYKMKTKNEMNCKERNWKNH